MFGALPDKALGFYGPLRYQHKQLAGELKILQWAHFVPSYDQWLDNTYVKQWGEQNDVEVKSTTSTMLCSSAQRPPKPSQRSTRRTSGTQATRTP